MKFKILLIINIFLTTLLAETSLLILPFCSSDVNPTIVISLENTIAEIVYNNSQYTRALSDKIRMMIMDRTNFDHCEYFMGNSMEDEFFQVIASVKVDEVLSCAVNYKDGQYGLFLKLRNSRNGALIRSKAYGYSGDFQQLLKKDLKQILYDFFDLQNEKSRFVSFSLAGGYLENFKDYCFGGKLGIGSDRWGEIAVETNLYTEKLAENISLVYTTPLKYWLFLKLGIGFTSERKNGFSLTEYYKVPNMNEITKMEHSAGALASVGISFPISNSFRLNFAVESDIIYSKWTFPDKNEEKGFIYSYYPEIEIFWQIKY